MKVEVQKGMTAVDIKNGSGLNFTILPDRAMDLAWATYKGIIYAGLFNKDLGETGIGVYIKFNVNQLDHFIQWKQMGERDYVLELEPATWYPEGRAKARRKNELKFIEPGEIKTFDLEIEIIEEEI